MTKFTNSKIKFLLQELNDWVGSEITIEKEERNDLDKNTLSLENVEIVKQVENEDDYVDPYSIELQGKGTVIQDGRKSTKLPLDSYELPLHELHSVEASSELLTVKTDRATYKLKK
ncbi:hypothetical protein BKP35_09165 [Anaerobacillus arseniciselenatis]|uniref:Uncharacterized protein n=1 Tax=Anaerobacillus arseniciselenatis TaxID=85682 RepID=A0A1S2LJP4_9BACI|nr:hypothetical protein [Anaerobacillus arseniciselenatis]OIJ12742.1 hypothetical protein BKP35_09165 [Anaerobacillus arseniciselenatis]